MIKTFRSRLPAIVLWSSEVTREQSTWTNLIYFTFLLFILQYLSIIKHVSNIETETSPEMALFLAETYISTM